MSDLMTISGKTVSFNSKHGAEIYRRSLILLLQAAVSELFPDVSIYIGQTLMHGYYFERDRGALPPGFLEKTSRRMRMMVDSDEKFEKKSFNIKNAMGLFGERGREDKVGAVSFLASDKLELVHIADHFDFVIAECVASAGHLNAFRLVPYNEGFIMQFPQRSSEMSLPGTENRQEKLYDIYLETRRWNDILGISSVPDLNRAVVNGSISEIIKIQEAFHEKKIGIIADRIKELFPEKRLIFVSGPSSSGKTTFLKRLGIQLRVNGFVPVEISLDDYFVPREKTPRMPSGELDFECLEALDTAFFAEQISALLSGSEIVLPRYDFKTGCRKKSKTKLKLNGQSVVVVEGIHALNPELCAGVSEDLKFGIFVSALTQLRIDNDTRIFTSDSRLMRRIIRDSLYRGYSAEESIKRFPLVREGEDRYVFPYQDDADIFFNSSLIYEQAVLKPLLEERLVELRGIEEVSLEAERLLNYLGFFLSVPSNEVPQTSILREFIGESGFKY